MSVNLILLIALVGLNIWDVLVTKRILARGGVELNPVIARLMERTGRWGFVKVGLALAIGAWLFSVGATLALAICVIAYAGVIAWNHRVLKRQS